MPEHLEGIEIEAIDTDQQGSGYRIDRNGVTRIEAFTKSGMHSEIPYVRVWIGDRPRAEFCQHQIVGIYFKAPTP